MACNKSEQHQHTHGRDCGHIAIRNHDQVAYLHDGELHVHHGDHVDKTAIPVSSRNPDQCTPKHTCIEHPAQHIHGPKCGHQQVPHGEHVDYLVSSHLHRAHGDHCDDHGPIEVERAVKAA